MIPSLVEPESTFLIMIMSLESLKRGEFNVKNYQNFEIFMNP